MNITENKTRTVVQYGDLKTGDLFIPAGCEIADVAIKTDVWDGESSYYAVNLSDGEYEALNDSDIVTPCTGELLLTVGERK